MEYNEETHFVSNLERLYVIQKLNSSTSSSVQELETGRELSSKEAVAELTILAKEDPMKAVRAFQLLVRAVLFYLITDRKNCCVI